MKKKVILVLTAIIVLIGYIICCTLGNKNRTKIIDNDNKKQRDILFISTDEFGKNIYDNSIVEKNNYSNIVFNSVSVNIPHTDRITSIKVKGIYPYKNKKNPMELLNEEMKFVSYYMGDNPDEKNLSDSSHGLEYSEMIEQIKKETYFDSEKTFPALTYCSYEGEKYKYAHVFAGFEIIWFDKGKIYEMEEGSKSTEPDEVCEVIKEYDLSDNLEDKYNLSNGEISVNDAIKFAEMYFDKKLPYETNKEVKMTVQHVKVIKVKKDVCALKLTMARNYNGIAFEYGGLVWDSTTDDKYDKDRAQVYMIDKDDVDIYSGTHNGNTDDVQEDEIINKVVSPDSIMKIISEKVGNNFVYNVSKIELIYRLKIINDGIGDNREYKGVPCYKVTGINMNDKKEVYFYVDVKTGNVEYSIKKVEMN